MISRGRRAVAATADAVRHVRLAELRDFLGAVRALGWAQLMVWRRPTGELLSHGASLSTTTDGQSRHGAPGSGSAVRPCTAANGPPAGVDAPPRLEQRREAERLARVVRIAARVGPLRPACLARALALQQLLEWRGITGASVRIGARLREGTFEAHAWVEYAGAVVGDDPLAPHFAPLRGRQPQLPEHVRFT